MAAVRAAKKTKTELKASAKEGLAMYGPRTGEKMTYWRALHIFVCICTAVLASAATRTETMNSIYKNVAMAEHVRKETVKDIWSRWQVARDAGNPQEGLDYWMNVPDKRSGNSQKQLAMGPSQYSQIDDLIQKELTGKDIYITAMAVKSLLHDNMGVTASLRTAKRILRRLGYKYGKLRKFYNRCFSMPWSTTTASPPSTCTAGATLPLRRPNARTNPPQLLGTMLFYSHTTTTATGSNEQKSNGYTVYGTIATDRYAPHCPQQPGWPLRTLAALQYAQVRTCSGHYSICTPEVRLGWQHS